MDDVAPVVSLVKLDLAAERGGRARLRGEFQILGGNGKGDGRVGVEVEKTGGGSHDLEVSEPFVPGGGGSSSFGDKDGSGETVDQEVALGLPVGVHGNEGVDGVHGADVESVVHDLEIEVAKQTQPEWGTFPTGEIRLLRYGKKMKSFMEQLFPLIYFYNYWVQSYKGNLPEPPPRA